ncbi:hypothetical protein ACFE04_021667 [Oxalis oulophora]
MFGGKSRAKKLTITKQKKARTGDLATAAEVVSAILVKARRRKLRRLVASRQFKPVGSLLGDSNSSIEDDDAEALSFANGMVVTLNTNPEPSGVYVVGQACPFPMLEELVTPIAEKARASPVLDEWSDLEIKVGSNDDDLKNEDIGFLVPVTYDTLLQHVDLERKLDELEDLKKVISHAESEASKSFQRVAPQDEALVKAVVELESLRKEFVEIEPFLMSFSL